MDYDDEDDYDIYPFLIYRGFDLSDLTEKEFTEVKDKIDLVYKDMTMIKEFCNKFLKSLESGGLYTQVDSCLNPSLYDKMLEHSINKYGSTKGTEIAYLILGKPEEFPQKILMAKAKALLLSYERQFEDEENEPVHPSDFEQSDLYKTITKLTGGKNIFPDLDYS